MNTTNPQARLRNWHRDLGYFFVGLLIAFSASGIAQNHRESFDPDRYVYALTPVKTDLHTLPKDQINETVIENLAVKHHIKSKMRFFRVEDEGKKLRVFFADGILDIDLTTGNGNFEILHVRPVIGHLTLLHRNSDSVWIWYSDVFAIGVLTICITGMFMIQGKNSFRKRGYLLTLAGVIVPLIFLIFLIK